MDTLSRDGRRFHIVHARVAASILYVGKTKATIREVPGYSHSIRYIHYLAIQRGNEKATKITLGSRELRTVSLGTARCF